MMLAKWRTACDDDVGEADNVVLAASSASLACSNDGLERTLLCNSVDGGWAYRAQMGLRPALKSLPTSPPLLVIICPHGGMPTW